MKTRCASAFTLPELLAVIAIILILMALVTPAFGPLMRASNLGKSVSMITDELNLARQLAVSQNRDIEIRFYKLPAENDPADLKFRAFRSFYANGADPTLSKPLGKLRKLPEGIVISDSGIYSTILDTDRQERKGSETLPGMTSASEYRSFQFRANGGTNLAPITGTWYLTGYPDNAPINSVTSLPENYFAAQVDPVTGRVRIFRP